MISNNDFIDSVCNAFKEKCYLIQIYLCFLFLPVLVSYCKLASSALTAATVAALSVKTSTPVAVTAVAAAQWSVSSSSSGNSTKVAPIAPGN